MAAAFKARRVYRKCHSNRGDRPDAGNCRKALASLVRLVLLQQLPVELTFRNLKSLNDVLPINLAIPGAVFCRPNTFKRLRVDLVKGKSGASVHRGNELNRDLDECQP